MDAVVRFSVRDPHPVDSAGAGLGVIDQEVGLIPEAEPAGVRISQNRGPTGAVLAHVDQGIFRMLLHGVEDPQDHLGRLAPVIQGPSIVDDVVVDEELGGGSDLDRLLRNGSDLTQQHWGQDQGREDRKPRRTTPFGTHDSYLQS